ncbi:hypothetical protein ACTLMW_002776 [Enterobacter roggenkampii]
MGMQDRKIVLGAVILGSTVLSATVKYATVRELTDGNLAGYKCQNHRRPERKLRRAKR